MDTLSRREEDALVKATKAKALKECDPIVKGTLVIRYTANMPQLKRTRRPPEFADCAAGRTISVAWACKDKYKAVQECMTQL